MSLKKTENILVLGLFLAFTGLLAALVLGFFSEITKEPIAQAQIRATNESLKAVLPAFEKTVDAKIKGVKYYGAFDKDNNIVGVAAESSGIGYAGDVTCLIGLELDGEIRAVMVIKHNETPGLGSNICDRKEQKTLKSLFSKQEKKSALAPNRILDFYTGKSGEFKIAKDGGTAPYTTGATITSRTVATVVTDVNNNFATNKDQIIAELTKVAKGEK